MIGYLRDHAVNYHIARKYKLGYVDKPLPGDERYIGRLSIPYLSPSGITAINFRVVGSGSPKYLKPHGQKVRLFNATAYFEAHETIGVTEGEMDAIAATEILGIPSLGVPGATSYQRLWTPLFRDFGRVLIFADGDQAGRDFAAEVAEEVGWRAHIVQCPEGHDVSSMCAAGRVSELRQLATGGDES